MTISNPVHEKGHSSEKEMFYNKFSLFTIHSLSRKILNVTKLIFFLILAQDRFCRDGICELLKFFELIELIKTNIFPIAYSMQRID